MATHYIDVSHRGARVGGVAFHPKPGEVVSLVSSGCDAQFLVIWVGEPRTPQEGQIGLQSINDGRLRAGGTARHGHRRGKWTAYSISQGTRCRG
jgi:hypothetical protein